MAFSQCGASLNNEFVTRGTRLGLKFYNNLIEAFYAAYSRNVTFTGAMLNYGTHDIASKFNLFTEYLTISRIILVIEDKSD